MVLQSTLVQYLNSFNKSLGSNILQLMILIILQSVLGLPYKRQAIINDRSIHNRRLVWIYVMLAKPDDAETLKIKEKL